MNHRDAQRVHLVSCRYPFGQDLKEFTNVVLTLVRSYVDVYYTTDEDVLNDRELSAFWDAMRWVGLARTGT